MFLFLPIVLLWTSIAVRALTPPPQTVFQQPDATGPIDYPYRALPWGELNIIHTTDTHGWLAGHQSNEPAYSGDWGDLYSFVTRMKEEATRKGVDVLFVDSGDRLDGNGLVDAEPAGHVKGYTAMQLFKELPYDILTTGNHELYRYPAARMVDEELRSFFAHKYIVSNVNISIDGQWRPIGERYRKFTTLQGRKVTAFGPIFNFRAHDKGIHVQAPHKMVHEAWFKEATQDAPDVFLLVGHMSVGPEKDSEWGSLVHALHAIHPDVPVLVLGGHHHIRDCVREDALSVSMASGRYMETVGWLAVNLTESARDKSLVFDRRYLDQNRNTYAFHAGSDFDTLKGRDISNRLTSISSSFNLTQRFGTAPHSYYLSRYHHRDPRSILHLLSTKVLPGVLGEPKERPRMVVYNTGSIRFDIFQGDFTKNDQWIICPFENALEYIPRVDLRIAHQLLNYLNTVGEHGFSGPLSDDERVESIYRARAQASYERFEAETPALASSALSYGYVTYDNCPGKGDDVLHKPIPYTYQPVFVATEPPATGDKIDVVFLSFIRIDILNALNVLQNKYDYSDHDVGVYVDDIYSNNIFEKYASQFWNA